MCGIDDLSWDVPEKASFFLFEGVQICLLSVAYKYIDQIANSVNTTITDLDTQL